MLKGYQQSLIEKIKEIKVRIVKKVNKKELEEINKIKLGSFNTEQAKIMLNEYIILHFRSLEDYKIENRKKSQNGLQDSYQRNYEDIDFKIKTLRAYLLSCLIVNRENITLYSNNDYNEIYIVVKKLFDCKTKDDYINFIKKYKCVVLQS